VSQFKILKPVWNGGKRMVGLADFRISSNNSIEIMYKDKTGVRIYPHQYSMSGSELKKYPLESFSPNMPLLRMVPIEDLHVQVERPVV
jgi:hypothetical protein